MRLAEFGEAGVIMAGMLGRAGSMQGRGRERTEVYAACMLMGQAAHATRQRTVIALVFLDYNSHANHWFAKGGHDLIISEHNERSNSSSHHF